MCDFRTLINKNLKTHHVFVLYSLFSVSVFGRKLSSRLMCRVSGIYSIWTYASERINKDTIIKLSNCMVLAKIVFFFFLYKLAFFFLFFFFKTRTTCMFVRFGCLIETTFYFITANLYIDNIITGHRTCFDNSLRTYLCNFFFYTSLQFVLYFSSNKFTLFLEEKIEKIFFQLYPSFDLFVFYILL